MLLIQLPDPTTRRAGRRITDRPSARQSRQRDRQHRCAVRLDPGREAVAGDGVRHRHGTSASEKPPYNSGNRSSNSSAAANNPWANTVGLAGSRPAAVRARRSPCHAARPIHSDSSLGNTRGRHRHRAQAESGTHRRVDQAPGHRGRLVVRQQPGTQQMPHVQQCCAGQCCFVRIALHLAQCDQPLGDPAVGEADRISGVLPPLIGSPRPDSSRYSRKPSWSGGERLTSATGLPPGAGG